MLRDKGEKRPYEMMISGKASVQACISAHTSGKRCGETLRRVIWCMLNDTMIGSVLAVNTLVGLLV